MFLAHLFPGFPSKGLFNATVSFPPSPHSSDLRGLKRGFCSLVTKDTEPIPSCPEQGGQVPRKSPGLLSSFSCGDTLRPRVTGAWLCIGRAAGVFSAAFLEVWGQGSSQGTLSPSCWTQKYGIKTIHAFQTHMRQDHAVLTQTAREGLRGTLFSPGTHQSPSCCHLGKSLEGEGLGCFPPQSSWLHLCDPLRKTSGLDGEGNLGAQVVSPCSAIPHHGLRRGSRKGSWLSFWKGLCQEMKHLVSACDDLRCSQVQSHLSS